MTFDDILEQAIELLRRRGRLTYRALKRQFDLDDEYLNDLKEELIYGQKLAVDEDERVLIWTGDTEETPASPPQRVQSKQEPSAQGDQSTQTKPPPSKPPSPEAERRQLKE